MAEDPTRSRAADPDGQLVCLDPNCPECSKRDAPATPDREEDSMVTDQGTTRIVFGKDSNGFIETTDGRPQEDEGAWRVYTNGYAVLGWDDLLAIGRWIAEHERRHDVYV